MNVALVKTGNAKRVLDEMLIVLIIKDKDDSYNQGRNAERMEKRNDQTFSKFNSDFNHFLRNPTKI